MSDDRSPAGGSHNPPPTSHTNGHGWWKRFTGWLSNGEPAQASAVPAGEAPPAAEDEPLSAKEQARSMMRNLVEFADLRVDDVMVPRADIIAIDEQASVHDLLAKFIEANHSRLPIYRETLDDPTGFLHVKDLVRWLAQRGSSAPPKRRRGKAQADAPPPAPSVALSAEDLATPIRQTGLKRDLLFVPPSMPATDLLMKMQATRIHVAIVVDEYGGTDGLASIEDLVEEIVGDIADEHDDDEQLLLKPLDDGVFISDARADIDDVEALLGIDLLPDEREEDADTLGGLVFSMLGRVPVRGELIPHPSGIEFEILEADPRRVKKLKIHTKPRPRRPQRRPQPADG